MLTTRVCDVTGLYGYGVARFGVVSMGQSVPVRARSEVEAIDGSRVLLSLSDKAMAETCRPGDIAGSCWSI